MKLPRRNFLHLAEGAAGLPAVSRIASAQAYPTRPVRIIVGFAAGGNVDLFARLIGQWLSERLRQPFIVENRPGAGTTIGTEAVVHAAPDGYTLLMASTAATISPAFYEKLNFNFVRDITPVAAVVRTPFVMAVHPSVPAKTLAEFIAYAKTNSGKLSMASSGIGTTPHVAGELFKMMAGVTMVHVPYRGAGPALTDLIAGQVHIYFTALPEAIEHIRAGRIRALAVTTTARSEVLRDIPSVSEILLGFEASFWAGLGAPLGTSIGNRRQAQQRDQRGSRRSKNQGAACRPRRHGAFWHSRRFWQVDRRRDREVGQGDQVCGHQARVIPPRRSVTPVWRTAAKTAVGTFLPCQPRRAMSGFRG
jgi:tripartite-type tricarboxylate transporter receptor subunit TctC